MYAVEDEVQPGAPSLWCSTCEVCASAGYTRSLVHIGILMRLLAAEPHSTAVPLFHSQCPSGTILLTLYSMVLDWLVSRAGPILIYWPKLLYPFCLLLFFNLFSLCPSVGIVGLGYLD